MKLKILMHLCLCCCVFFWFEKNAYGETSATAIDEEDPKLLGVGIGLGMHYLPTLRLELRPTAWLSIAGRVGVGVIGGFRKLTDNYGHSEWMWREYGFLTVGGQISGLWPVGDGHYVALRVGLDSAVPLGINCDALYPGSCEPDSYILFDSSTGWGWQSGAWEIRIDCGFAYVKGIENEPYEKAGEPAVAPTFMITGLYWIL